jgi:ribonuclease H2 subunit A
MEFEVGIDEAGRGPVIGPMVYACCAWPIQNREEYKQIGFADSKILSEPKREELFSLIENNPDMVFKTIVLSPERISNAMLSRQKVSLNVLSMNSAEDLVRLLLAAKVNVKEVYVDTVGKPEPYENRLSRQFPGIKFKVTAKADSLFSVVSAASIVAKVTRDREINSYKETLGEIGSGYPSDPNTQRWLKENLHPVFGYPSKYVRISWSTCTVSMQNLPKVTWPEDMENRLGTFHYYEKLGIRDNIV